MKIRTRLPIAVMMLSTLMMSCLLPGMIPLNPEPESPLPYMEKDADKVLEILQGENWHSLSSLATEQYSEEDYAKPGTLTYTVTITDDLPTYFSYGWCAVDEATLRQNFEHIRIGLYINEELLPSDVVQNLSFTAPSDMLCADIGVLISEWPAGEYKLEAVTTFNEEINDGLADFAAGDYIFIYNVTVEK